MNWKDKIIKELKEVRQLADYDSEKDPEATHRLQKIREKTEIALEAIKQSEDI